MKETNQVKTNEKKYIAHLTGWYALGAALIIIFGTLFITKFESKYKTENQVVNDPKESVFVGTTEGGDVNIYSNKLDSLTQSRNLKCDTIQREAQKILTDLKLKYPRPNYMKDEDLLAVQYIDELKEIMNYKCDQLYLQEYEANKIISEAKKLL